MSNASNDPAILASKFINQTNKSVFLTGKAGTGKTTFLKSIIEKTHKRAVIVAPTGIAAINAGGVTIHSQFQLPFGAYIPSHAMPVLPDATVVVNNMETLRSQVTMTTPKRRTLQTLELLIIDEVSMLRADVLDAIDATLRRVRSDYFRPFGGVQVLFIGDLMQLPPVVKNEEWAILKDYYEGMFFFHAKVLQEERPQYIELEKIYRQSDIDFINILENLRNNRMDKADLEILNRYFKPNFKPTTEDNYITLTTHNAKANLQNQEALEALQGVVHRFKAEVQGTFPAMSYPTDAELVLKIEAQVIFIKNDPSGRQRFFNGKIAIIHSITDDGIEVRFKDEEETFTVNQYEWRNIEYKTHPTTKEIEENVIGTFTQYPLKLAWAITVHKSQGLTFERAVIDVNGAFAPGQVYVALSRLKSLDGLVLSSKIATRGIYSDEQVIRFATNKKAPDEINGILELEIYAFLKELLYKTFDFTRLLGSWKRHVLSYEKYDKAEGKSEKQKHEAWASTQHDILEPIKKHGDTFLTQLHFNLDKNPPNLAFVAQRQVAANTYFSTIFEEALRSVRIQKEKMRVISKTKVYQEELTELESQLSDYLNDFKKSAVLVQGVLAGKEITKEDFKVQSN
jgi:hypothetical protein